MENQTTLMEVEVEVVDPSSSSAAEINGNSEMIQNSAQVSVENSEVVIDIDQNQEDNNNNDSTTSNNDVDIPSSPERNDQTQNSSGMTEGDDDNLEEQFLELLKCEEESERYLEKLNAEEAELRKAVDCAVRENHTLRLLESALEAKIAAQRQGREKLGVESLQERNKEMRKESQKVREEADSIRLETLTRSTTMMIIHAEDTAKLQNRLKEFRSPQAVDNAINTKKVQITQIKSQVHKALDELDNVNGQIAKLLEQRDNFKVFEEVVMESKELEDKENQF